MFNIPTVTVDSETLDDTAASVTLTYAAPNGVAWTPRHLLVRVNARSTRESNRDDLNVTFNGDTGSNYNRQFMYGQATTAAAARTSAAASTQPIVIVADSQTASVFGGGEFLVPDALSTRTHKSVLGRGGAVEDMDYTMAGRWASTAAITSVTVAAANGNLMAGSTFELCVVDESFNIDEQIKTVGTGDGTFTVSSISAADGDLVSILNARSDRGASGDGIKWELNSDTTGSNYDDQELEGASTTVTAQPRTNTLRNVLPANSITETEAFGAAVFQFTNFSDGSNDRVASILAGHHADSSTSEVNTTSARWNNTAAITALKLSPREGTNFKIDSMLSTYAVPKNLITRTELTGNTYPVTISSIPDTYDHLELSIYAKASVWSAVNCQIYFNGETSSDVANYKRQLLQGRDSAASANTSAGDSTHFAVTGTDSSSTAEEFSSVTFTFYNYKKTDRHKHFMAVSGVFWSNLANSISRITSGRWASTAAITSITINPNDNASGASFVAGSVFTLRGISADIAVATFIPEVRMF